MPYFNLNSWDLQRFVCTFWLIIIGLLIWFAHYIVTKNHYKIVHYSFSGILKRKYTKGEISKVEFQEQRKDKTKSF